MGETRKLAAILVADVVGYSLLAGADEEGTLARLRGLRGDLIEPAIAAHHGRIVKRTGDGAMVEFRSVVDAVRCAIEMQTGLIERNAGVPDDRRIRFRVGIHLGDVVEESDGDLMGDGVNIAARLEGVAEPGAICLSEDAYRQVKSRLDLNAVDLGAIQLKNIVEPVRAYSLDVGESAVSKPPLAPERSGAPRLSLVALPFANIGGDSEQEYFVDGLIENLTTDLSRIREAFVIARSTAFTYKDKAIDLKRIGRELNVRYVLEGSVQRSGSRVRVNVQLIEAETGRHLWAERFDKPLADLFDMQDEIVARIANQLQAELIDAEARRAQQTPNPDSMDLLFQGRALLNRGLSPDLLAQARRLYERALELDGGNVDALVGIGAVDAVFGTAYMADDPTPLIASAESALARALAVAPNHARALWIMGYLHCATHRASRGMEELERALAIDPNFARAHGTMGLAQIFVGRGGETEAHVLEALRLSPRDAYVGYWFLYVGSAKAHLGRHEEGLAWLRRSINANRNNPWAFFIFAASLALLGRLDEARLEARAGLAVDRKFTIARFRAAVESDNPVYLAQRERLIEGMRLAGVPEE
jgi:TolB-like protein